LKRTVSLYQFREKGTGTMTKKLLSMAAGAAVLAFAGSAYAGQPLPLSDKQMDGVTAGAIGLANAEALALGEVLADTVTHTSTNTVTVTPRIAIGQSFAQALAAGGFLFQAAAAVHADSAASLP
jgi:hypothetical protein